MDQTEQSCMLIWVFAGWIDAYLVGLALDPLMSCVMLKPTKWLCAQQRPRLAWASAQSDQSSLSAWRKLGSLATQWANTLIRLGVYLGWSESSLSAVILLVFHEVAQFLQFHYVLILFRSGLCRLWSVPDCTLIRTLRGKIFLNMSRDMTKHSDQPGHLPSLIRVFAVRMKKPWVLSCPLNAQQSLWSDFAGRTLILLVLSCRGSYKTFC